MASLIERYVHEVTHRLPEKDREEVKRELTANIYDMLSDNPGDEEVAAVLNGLGSPRILADKYRQKPNYLISPAVYPEYIRTLKFIVPLVGCILLALGAIFGAIESLGAGVAIGIDGMVSGSVFLKNIFSQGISLGIAGAFHALFWTTLGFVIADRRGILKEKVDAPWTVAELPDEIVDDKGRIPLSDSIVGLALSLVFTLVFILLLLGILPFTLVIESGSVTVHEFLAPGFAALLIPLLLIACGVQVIVSAMKIAKRRWTVSVCATVLAGNIIGIGLLVFLAMQSEVLSPEFLAFLELQEWWQATGLRLSFFTGMNIGQQALVILAALAIFGTLIDSGTTIYKTVRANRDSLL